MRDRIVAIAIQYMPFPGCTDTCTDYHRLCPGTTNAAFFAQYQSDVTSGLLAKFEADETPQPDCNNRLFAYLCPQSCGLCEHPFHPFVTNRYNFFQNIQNFVKFYKIRQHPLSSNNNESSVKYETKIVVTFG